jgi:hypothetical protein
MLFLPACPLGSLSIVAMDVVALYGLCADGSRENMAAAQSNCATQYLLT